MRYQFIEEHRDMFYVHLMCRLLKVSRSGYYSWRIRPVSQREMANRELVKKIKAVHSNSQETYGSPRVYQELKAQCIACSENRVARLMQSHGIRAKQVKRKKVTTKANGAHPVAPNLLNGNFTAERPDEKWLADISYIPTAEGWLYLAVIMDLFTRRIVGWSMAARMTSMLVEVALKMALQQRQPPPGLLHHSDRGSQYTCKDYQTLMKSNLIEVSMSGAGNCYDNAPIESLFGTLKTELVHHRAYRTREEAKTDIFFYIEGFYNRRRRHSALGYLSPVDFELLHQELSMLASCPQN